MNKTIKSILLTSIILGYFTQINCINPKFFIKKSPILLAISGFSVVAAKFTYNYIKNKNQKTSKDMVQPEKVAQSSFHIKPELITSI